MSIAYKQKLMMHYTNRERPFVDFFFVSMGIFPLSSKLKIKNVE